MWAQHGRIVAQLQEWFPEAARLLVEAAQTYWPSPASLKEYWRQISSNNPQERLTASSGGAPTSSASFHRAAVLRLVGALAEQHDESPSPGAT